MQSKLLISGKLLEYVHYEKNTDLSTSRGIQRRPSSSTKLLFKTKRIDNLARTRRLCVRKLFTACEGSTGATFATFTTTEKHSTHSAKVSGNRFSAFLKRLQRKYKGKYAVIAVWERHKSGRIHIHAMLFGGEFDRERENRILATLWGWGNVDVKSHDRTPKMLYYVAKYITKQNNDFEYNVPSYWCTRNIDKSLEFHDENAEFFDKKIKGNIINERSTRSVYFGTITRKTRLL